MVLCGRHPRLLCTLVENCCCSNRLSNYSQLVCIASIRVNLFNILSAIHFWLVSHVLLAGVLKVQQHMEVKAFVMFWNLQVQLQDCEGQPDKLFFLSCNCFPVFMKLDFHSFLQYLLK